jgi:acetaldehyde/propanal dehydrogenase
MRSEVLEPVWMVGASTPTSEGLARARELGLKTTAEGVDGHAPRRQEDQIQIAFDATSPTCTRAELATSSMPSVC